MCLLESAAVMECGGSTGSSFKGSSSSLPAAGLDSTTNSGVSGYTSPLVEKEDYTGSKNSSDAANCYACPPAGHSKQIGIEAEDRVPVEQTQTGNHHDLEAILERALDDYERRRKNGTYDPFCESNELQPHYQPIFDIKTRRWCAFEALIRWRSKELGKYVFPDQFIPIAERSELIERIGKWSTYHACEHLARCGDRVHHISVNIAPKQFMNPEFVAYLERLSISEEMRRKLVFELTERRTEMELQQLDVLGMVGFVEMLRKVRNLGFHLALDDGGACRHNMQFILDERNSEFLRLFTTIKVDGTLVCPGSTFAERKVSLPKEDLLMQLVGRAHELGLNSSFSICAEMIETEAQLEVLQKTKGITQGQGWLVAKAMPFSEAYKGLLQQEQDAGCGSSLLTCWSSAPS
jgi:EAL domain-containing protein (putative c-di-GMP-specific phosphodiesterase class I)